MASFTFDRRTGKYRARIRRTRPDGERFERDRTFAQKHQAARWAYEIEAAFDEWRVAELTRRDARMAAEGGTRQDDEPTI